MSEWLRDIIFVGVLAFWSILFSIGVVSWFAMLIYSIKTVRRAQPGVNIWGNLGARGIRWNPFNLLLRPHLLTDAGRACRKKCFIATAIFFGSIGTAFVLISMVYVIFGLD